MGTRVAVLTGIVVLFVGVGCGRKTLRADAYNDLALEAARHGLWREASFRWQKALQEKPDDPRFWNNLGVAYESQEQFKQALDAYRRASAADPQNATYERNLRRAERHQERVSKIQGKNLPEEIPFPSEEPIP